MFGVRPEVDHGSERRVIEHYPCIACGYSCDSIDNFCAACGRKQLNTLDWFEQVLVLEARLAAKEKRIEWLEVGLEAREETAMSAFDDTDAAQKKLKAVTELLRRYKWDEARQLVMSDD